MSKNVKASYTFLALSTYLGKTSKLILNVIPGWSLLTALLIIINYLNKMTDFIKDVGISYNIKNNKIQSITNFNFPRLIKPCMHASISEF
jgi:hypothetical protein